MTILLNNINSFLQNDVLTLLLTIIWFFSFSLILSDLLNKKQGEMYLLSFIISSLLLFIGGIFNNIKLFYYIGWVLILVYLVYVICKKKIKDLLSKIDLFSSIMFLIILIILLILYQNKGFVATDEFMHWGPMVRDMFNINKFYCVPEATLEIHKDYPPLFSLIELLFCIFKGEYRECYLYVALIYFYFSIAIAIMSKKEKILDKSLILLSFILLGFTAQTYPSSMFEIVTIYASIYIDYVLVVFAAYVIYSELIAKTNTYQDKIIRILFSSALLLSKQIGIVFFLLYALVLFTRKRLDIISIVLPIIPLGIWKIITYLYQITGQFSFSNVLLRDSGFIIKDYLKALLIRPIFIRPIPCSFIAACVVLIALLMFVSYKEHQNYYLAFLVGTLLYSVTLMVLYCFVFSIDEAITLASFERYMYTYVLFGFAYILLIIFDNFDNKLIHVLACILLFVFSDFDNSNIYKIVDHKDILVIKQWGDKISFEESRDNGYVLNFKIHEYINDNINYDELTKEISNYHYLYVYLYDDNFYNYWVDYTGDYGLENDSVFYIANNGVVSYSNDNFSKIHHAIKYYLHIDKQ